MHNTPRTFAIFALFFLFLGCSRTIAPPLSKRLPSLSDLLFHRSPAAAKPELNRAVPIALDSVVAEPKTWVATKPLKPLPEPPKPEPEPAAEHVPPVILASLLPSEALDRVDSLATRLQEQVAQDTPKTRSEGLLNRRRFRRPTNPTAFPYKDQNIRPTDTVFVDTLGIRAAFWVTDTGIKMRWEGSMVKEVNEAEITAKNELQTLLETLLLYIGIFAAFSIMASMLYAVFTPLKQANDETEDRA